MKDSLPKLPLDKHQPFAIPFYSEGDYSMHELIDHVLEHYGEPCIIRLSSFSITEEAVRMFINRKEEGIIHEISCLFDHSVKHHKLQMLFFGLHAVDHVYLYENHSKLVLFEYVGHRLLIVGSPNLNINRKIEAGLLLNDPGIYDFFYNKLTKSMLHAVKININDFN